ncbi:MAG: DoxX family protein [Planctomycetes bacterium]|nr:DoxX family protein [Planctomycetota bacterium]
MNALTTYAPHAARLLLGLIFVVFGLNGFLNFIPIPPPTGAAAEFMGGLAAAGYFFPLLKGTEIVVGLALLSNRFVPLALVVLAPITINIVAFNILEPAGLPLAILIVGLQGGLAWYHRAAFRPLLTAVSADREEVAEEPAGSTLAV